MKKQLIDLMGQPFEADFPEHDITPYNVLFHITLKENRKGIEEKGLQLNQPMYKSMVDSGMLFFSYPIDMDTSDCFRWNDELHSLIVLDAVKLREDGFKFYDDYFGSEDMSSKRNHLAIDRAIPKEYIKKVLEF